MRPADLLSSLLLFTAATNAWPSGWNALDAAKREIAPLVARQNDNNNNNNNNDNNNNQNDGGNNNGGDNNNDGGDASASASPTEGDNASSESPKETGNGDASSTSTGKDSKTTGDSETTGKGKDGEKTTSKYETTKTFDERLPAGGVSMITPGPLDPSQYYKIEDYITFAWNYTSLSITPSAVDILASCSVNSATYTIALNQTISGPTQAVTWDTGEYQSTATIPLLIASYTLIIYDSDSSPDATARAGYLGAYNQFQFGMYTPQPYTPIADFVCATCSGAISSMERHTLGFLGGTVALTVLSFGWFAGVAGLW